MSELRFAEPQWIHGVWAVLGFGVLLVISDRRARRALRLLVAPSLRTRLVHRATPAQRRLRIAMLTLSGLFAVLALMRPQWGLEFLATPRASAELMVAVDVSRSMLAEDVVPNRLERAKAEVRDLLAYLEGDHVGLIAFAGRASVLAPLTPDFSFLRLVLDDFGAHSVSRGGTRLEEPIRKALAGFRATGDVARVILLITDGEDLDSFPLDAARAAAERGIAIITIGLGSGEGSDVPLTDPTTGARALLRDSEGRVVRSRLDATTLSEIARLTGGVYVPAGTGALDLDSIYEAHIAGLMRGQVDGSGRPVRNEGFQWLVLCSLLSLVGATLLGRARPLAAAAVIALLYAPGATLAQEPDPLPPVPAATQGAVAEATEQAAEPEELTTPELPSPREAYNLGLESLKAQELEEAQRLFELARSTAETDGETRYRAIYGLGWAGAASADRRLDGAPEEALVQLFLAADRFRDSLRLRPGSEDARHNLEVVLTRARVLEDSLREQDARSLAASLDELSQRQRQLVAGVRSSVEQKQLAGALSEEALRSRHRELSTQQRLILSDSDLLAGKADSERRQLETKPEAERQPQDQLRAAQLSQLLPHLRRARERMGHARRELRQQQSERGHRRASVALAELNLARDQLRDPVEVLDALIRDGTEVGGYTQLYALRDSGVPGSGSEQQRPDWLSIAYLVDALDGITERTASLRATLVAGLSQPAGAELEPGDARLLAAVRQAEPLVAEAWGRLARARDSMARDAALEALVAERTAVSALTSARELFLGLRGLIELTYADQLGLGQLASEAPLPAVEMLPRLYGVQQRNLSRASRIGQQLDEELAALRPDSSEEELDEQRTRLLVAKRLLARSEAAMEDVGAALRRQARRRAPDLEVAARPNVRAVAGLDALRRLFFSIVEQLRDTAQQQLELNDETEQTAALPNPVPALGPLIPRQAKLAHTTGVLAGALEAQSRQTPAAAPSSEEQESLSPEAVRDASDRLRRAAELTLAAQAPMQSAAEQLAADQVDAARGDQDQGLEHLRQALALLTPPERQEGERSQADAGQQGEPETSDTVAAAEQQAADPSQLLQEVRDREARRRRERARQQRRTSSETVEKDW